MSSDPEAWTGGAYELNLYYGTYADLRKPLEALWSHPSLNGPVECRNLDASDQQIIDLGSIEGDLAQNSLANALFGRARLTNGAHVPCGSVCLRYEGGETHLEFWMPNGSLARAVPGWTYGNWERWARVIDAYMVEIAEYIFERAPFARGLVEIEGDAYDPLRFPGPVPAEHGYSGILDVVAGSLSWHPPTASPRCGLT